MYLGQGLRLKQSRFRVSGNISIFTTQ